MNQKDSFSKEVNNLSKSINILDNLIKSNLNEENKKGLKAFLLDSSANTNDKFMKDAIEKITKDYKL